MNEIQNKKQEINNLIIYKKKINKLMDIFLNNYNDIFIKKDLIKYDDIIDLDFKIKDAYLEFLVIINKFNDFEYENENINKMIKNLLNTKDFEIETFHKNEMFDILYHSYILVQIFLVSSYLLSNLFFEYKVLKTKNKKNQDLTDAQIKKIKYRSSTTYIAKYIFKDTLIFKKWDQLEQKIDAISFEIEDKHPNLKESYIITNKKFKTAFNNFYLVSISIKDSNYVNKLGLLLNYYYIIIIVIVLIALSIFLIAYFYPKK